MKTSQINQTIRLLEALVGRAVLSAPPSPRPPVGRAVLSAPPPFPSVIPPKWRRHCRALLRLRERFMQDRRALAEDSKQPLERSTREIAESATTEFERELALAELAHTQDALYEIDAALDRIQSGEYGFCQQTGKPIPAARLRAVPWTRFTREAEVRLEQNGAVSRTRLGELRSLRETKQKGR